MTSKLRILATFLSLCVFVAIAPAAEMAVTFLSINTDTGAISINDTPLVAGTDFTFTLVNSNAGITGGRTWGTPPTISGYSQIGLFELSSSYLTGYDGISIDAVPDPDPEKNCLWLAGAKPLALAVPGNIIINTLWQQNGSSTWSGTNPGSGAPGVCGGYKGGSGSPYAKSTGDGPGGGSAGDTGGDGSNYGAGGSLVALGAPRGGTVMTADFPSDFHEYGGSITIDGSGPVRDLCGGSGGGNQFGSKNINGGSGGGGAVGFFSTVDSGSITVTAIASIQANGGGATGGGGGAGGTIILASGAIGTVTNDGSLQAKGGTGGAGNGGGGGEIAIYYGGSAVLGSGTYSVTGANAGHYYTEQLLAPTTGSLTIKKFCDTNQDAVFNGYDEYVAGWEYNVSNVAHGGTYDEDHVTDENGRIDLTGLDAGDYTITETLKKDWTLTTGNSPVVVAVSGGLTHVENFGNILPGDANMDGMVDGVDFTYLKANFGQGTEGDPTVWREANFNYYEGDWLVDGADFTILKANFGKGEKFTGSPVPEPATLVLLGAALPVLLKRRRNA